MITIELSITPGPTLTPRVLEKLCDRAESMGKTPEELLAELIVREVEKPLRDSDRYSI